ncbi:MAG: beta-lactamase family protein, partial [Gemmatimonadota bacterium]
MFAPWDRHDSPGAAVAVVRDGEVVHASGYGAAQLEYDIPIEPSTVFHIASVSKQFTAFAVALLVSDKSISLDDDIRTYLPEIPDYGYVITIRHLLH